MNFKIAVNVTLCGIVIVFLMLFILIAIMYIQGFFTKGNKVPKKDKQQEKGVKQSVEIATPIVDDSISEEVAAAISAVVYSIYESRSITPVIKFIGTSKRNAWAKAGIAKNTKAF